MVCAYTRFASHVVRFVVRNFDEVRQCGILVDRVHVCVHTVPIICRGVLIQVTHQTHMTASRCLTMAQGFGLMSSLKFLMMAASIVLGPIAATVGKTCTS